MKLLLSTMKNGRTLGQSGRFTQLEPVIPPLRPGFAIHLDPSRGFSFYLMSLRSKTAY